MATRRLIRLLLCGTLLGVSAGRVQPAPAPPACAEAGTLCPEFYTPPIVFIGTVTDASPEFAEDDPAPKRRPQTVSFDVIEGFKGTASGAETLVIDPADPEQRVFANGETVIVYAKRSGGRNAPALWSV